MTERSSLAADVRRHGAYPEYQPARELFGKIPTRWEAIRLKHLVRFRGGGTPAKDKPEFWRGDIPWVSPKDMKRRNISRTIDRISVDAVRESATSLIDAGAVLIVVRSGILRHTIPVGITRCPATLNQDLKALITTDRICAEYLAYTIEGVQPSLLSSWRKEGATVESLEMGLVGVTPFPVPTRAEQRTIANFLDRETAKIDVLVAKKERLIELLQEKRTALITHAVTQGLDPNVPMKPSAIDWLGDIPAHWEVKRLWHLTPDDRRIMYGIVLPGPNVEDGIPIVKGGDVSPGRLRLDRLSRTTREIESGYVRSRLKGGDLVFAIRGSVGEVAVVPDELEGANMTQDAARIACRAEVHGPWLLYALKSLGVFAQLEAGALGATIRGINIRDLKRASIPMPPPAEQVTIASFLNLKTVRIEVLFSRVQAAIDHLKEFRTALISAAVTGKIDVRQEVE